jgi:hypothetical protein
MPNTDGALLHEIHVALEMNQRQLGEFLGISKRTAQRVDAGESTLSPDHFTRIARALHGKQPALAARVAKRAGTTLQGLGLAAPTQVAAVSPKAPPPHPRVAESVVCAAADVMQLTPSAVRPALLAAFKRARELGLNVEMIAEALEEVESR